MLGRPRGDLFEVHGLFDEGSRCKLLFSVRFDQMQGNGARTVQCYCSNGNHKGW